MRYLLSLSLLILTSCGPGVVHKTGGNLLIDASLQPYFDSFKEELKARNVDIKINNIMITQVNDLPLSVGANCNRGGSMPVIKINAFFWNLYGEEDKEAMLFHELGHCILGRGHDDTIVPDRFTTYTQIPGFACANRNYSYRQGNQNMMPTSLMASCSVVSSYIYSSNNDPLSKTLIRAYYIDELIGNRVPGYYANF